MTNAGVISSTSAGGVGAAGSIAITTDTLTNLANGTIQSATGGKGGAQGQISIAAASTVNAESSASTPTAAARRDAKARVQQAISQYRAGPLTNSGKIRAATTGAAAAGGINIDVQSFENLTGATIQSQTKAAGAARAVNIVTNLFTNQQSAVITTLADVGSSGAAGQVSIQAASVRNDGFINSNT